METKPADELARQIVQYRERQYSFDGSRWVQVKPFRGWFCADWSELTGQPTYIEASCVTVPADKPPKR